MYRCRRFWYDLTMKRDQPLLGREFRDAFFRQHPGAESIVELFEYLPSAFFYAKDSAHRYIGVNTATLNEVFGLVRQEDLLGRTDADFQPPALAEAYHSEDRRVMDGGRTLPNQVWLVPHVCGAPRWYVSTKTPLRDPRNKVIGIAGVMYPIETPEEQATSFKELLPVIRYIDQHYTEGISMSDMAAMARLSATHFNARFREILRMSPTQYVLSRRIQNAQNRLTSTSQSIADIGFAVGFFDQSHFTKRFRKITGMTPLAYRKRFRQTS